MHGCVGWERTGGGRKDWSLVFYFLFPFPFQHYIIVSCIVSTYRWRDGTIVLKSRSAYGRWSRRRITKGRIVFGIISCVRGGGDSRPSFEIA